MRSQFIVLIAVLICLPGALFADHLTWGNTYVANWNGFGTSPYTAVDTTTPTRQTIQIFCLDFNNEIGPPFDWDATVMSLNQKNVSGTGHFAGENAAHYGGEYNDLLTAAFNDTSNPRPVTETTAPQVSETNNGVPRVSGQDAYTRYLEAAWLFAGILEGLAGSPRDVNTDMIAQVAAWELFVDPSHRPALTSAVQNYRGSFVFNNYLALNAGETYLNTSAVTKRSTSALTFAQAVDAALAAAQHAVVDDLWGPGSSHYGSWSLITATPEYVVGFGRPVQEFLSPNAPRYSESPEPATVLLLAAAGGIALFASRKRGPARNHPL